VFNWRDLDLKVVGWFALGAMPMAALGAWIFTISSPALLTRLLGAFMLGFVMWRHLNTQPLPKCSAAWFLPLGAGYGFLSGVVQAAGSLLAPFYLAYGLSRNAYIGTDAFATALMQSAKLATLSAAPFVTPPVAIIGVVLIPFMILGAYVGRRTVERLSERAFTLIIETVMVISGLYFLLRA
jgi:uncharacterized membrane protein YfcA